MKKSKKFIAGVMALCLAGGVVVISSSIVPTVAVATSEETTKSGTCGENLIWVLDDEGTLTISGTGNMEDYYSWSTKPWLEKSVKTIIINEGVTNIGEYAFYGCRSLASIIISDSVTSIGDYAFEYCSGLTSITIPNSVTSIEAHVFQNCSSLISITIPDSITSIENSAFYTCSKLKEINISENNKFYCSIDGVLFNKDKTALICYPREKSKGNYYVSDFYIIPDSVTKLEDYAFYGCAYLEI